MHTKKKISSVITQALPSGCTHRELSFEWSHLFRFGLQENDLSLVITQTVPLECTHRELSFEWSHRQVSLARK